ncbi:Glycosyltransferase involved in cell wall bisynthesis [Mucilaginibacter gossypiicola]|uniref:Glycosyltransferase involved in cell wall bisynthesis n=1 Tax=Mucilaginibacter gossypiicola TaxID=551995 RepID=A0A1H8ALN3_9SPHI|nr:glycosyltransferase family 1 protein [Mucilaginibacter gossypiicola]SEM71416.1 Glycosyltransferase involved in cell wall bisynthesis [Mucilaginibacter gossypiicola]
MEKQKKNIIINARFLTQKLTGVQRFAIEIARQLNEMMPDLVFVAPSDIIHHEVAAELNVIIIGKCKGVMWEQLDLPLYLKRNNKPLLINLCNVAPLFYTNQVITIHDVASFVNPQWFSKNFVRFYKFLMPRISKKAKLIFTVSDFSKAEIIKYLHVDAVKIKVVYNGVSELPAPSFIETNYGKYILAVGSIDKRKNIQNLVEAFGLIKHKNFKLIIVGDSNAIFNNEGNENLKTRNDIIFTGRVNDHELANLYTGAQLFAYPSLYEGFGIPPLEAMAYGCPTLVSDIGSLREVCGNASMYINPLDTKEISKGIDLLIDDSTLRNTLVKNGNQNLKRFSWENSAMQIFNSITFLIAQS